MQEMIKQWLASLVRHALSGVIVWLMAKGDLSSDQINNVILGIVGIGVAVGWSFINKWFLDSQINTALKLPAGTPRSEL